MKSLAAVLSHCWLVRPEWVFDSSKAKKFISESGYGNRWENQPLAGIRFFLSEEFRIENETKEYKIDCAQKLVIMGKGTLVDSREEADHVLVATKMHSKDMTWGEFIALIPTLENP